MRQLLQHVYVATTGTRDHIAVHVLHAARASARVPWTTVRSVEGGSELDASRAWASAKDVYRAADAQARSTDVATTSTTGAGGESTPPRPALG